jgi:hypothetical protein
MVDVDEQRAQVLDLGLRVGGVPRERARELEEVEEQGLDELLKLEGAVVVLGVFGVGEACDGEVGDALFFEGGELVVELEDVSAGLGKKTTWMDVDVGA